MPKPPVPAEIAEFLTRSNYATTHVSIVGHVAEWIPDPNLVDIDRISSHYDGEPYGKTGTGPA